MNGRLKLAVFGKYLEALNSAGVETATARGFWGGVAADGTIVVTSWIDANCGERGFYIWRPERNRGGLKTEWANGNIRVRTEVRLILLRQRGDEPLEKRRSVAGAALMPEKWRIAKMVEHNGRQAAIIEPVTAKRS